MEPYGHSCLDGTFTRGNEPDLIQITVSKHGPSVLSVVEVRHSCVYTRRNSWKGLQNGGFGSLARADQQYKVFFWICRESPLWLESN